MVDAAVVALIAFASLAPAQSPDGRLLRPGTDSLAVFVIRGADTTRTGLVVDELSVSNSGGRAQLHRVYRSADQLLGS